MLAPLFRRQLAGQFAGFRGQTAASGRFRIVGLFWRGSLLLFHNRLNLPFPGDIVKSGQAILAIANSATDKGGL